MPQRCKQEGIVFIGPSPQVIDQMGDKVKARQIMKAAGVPVVPGSDGILTSEEEVLKTIESIGYPCMLKAVAGGGGKGLRLVRSRREVSSAFRAVGSEASSSFGDARLYVEKFIEKPRHVEIQMLADSYGHVIHLYDRECSIQRRHQKVIEESPAPGMDDRTRRRIGRIAIQGARAVGYVGAGTLEFLLDQEQNFYFLEMNTRLQVEHAVTERVVGIDLVKAQIEVAAGGYLPWRQRHITQTGHAIECRIYAEDPERDFMPCPGKIEGLRLPEGLGLRNDCGVYEGAEVPIYYDPMIAKLITWGENRVEAILRMRRALREYQVRGIKTNISFNQWILRHPRFMSGDVNTGFIDEEYRAIEQRGSAAAQGNCAGVGGDRRAAPRAGTDLGFARQRRRRTVAMARARQAQCAAARNADAPPRLAPFLEICPMAFIAKLGEQSYTVEIEETGKSVYRVSVDGNEFLVDGKKTGRTNFSLIVDNRSFEIEVDNTDDEYRVLVDGRNYRIHLVDERRVRIGGAQAGLELQGRQNVSVPMPGKIIAVLVGEGDAVEKGQGLVIVEAMKMENEVRSPIAGEVKEIKVKPGDTVEGGAVLLDRRMNEN